MKKVGILVRKEMTEILRDKKTLIIMVLMPLLLYPAIVIGMTLIINMISSSMSEASYTVGYRIEDEAYMEPLMTLYEEDAEENIVFKGASTDEEASLKEEADVWVSFLPNEQSLQIQVAYTSTDTNSGYAESVMEDLIEDYRDVILLQNLEQEGLTKEFLNPVTYEAVDSVSDMEASGMSMGNMLVMVLILMIMLGAFYPAVDVTTGEKERGTLETLLTLPVTNFQMIMSKFIAVSTFACITAVLSLVALGGSFLFLALGAESGEGGLFAGIPVEYFLACIPVLLLSMITAALLITAVCMCFCVFAKSSKEANNYMTPVMLVIMFASMVGMIPSVELNAQTALIPLVNICLMFKQIFAQQMDLYLAIVTILINVAYSVIIIWVLAKMYDSENIMFSDDFKSFRLFQKRGDIKKGTIPATGDILLAVILQFLLNVYLSCIIKDVLVGTIVVQLTVLGIPLLVTWYMKTDMKALFCLKKPTAKIALGSILLYIGSYMFMLLASVVMSALFPESLQNMDATYEEFMSNPFLIIVLVMAVMPAIGEELLFRGLVFGSLRHKYKIGWAILISALIFGAGHLSLVKLIPTAILGACFAYAVYKGGSIYISMALHFINNFMSVFVMQYPETAGKLLPILTKEEFSNTDMIIMLLLGAVCVAAGLWIMNGKVKTEKNLTNEKCSVDM